MIKVFSYIQNTKAERYGMHVTEIGDYKEAMPTSDPNYESESCYVSGAIELIVDGEYFFTKENSFDCIVSFWRTLINVIRKLIDNEDALESYPGQPIDIRAKHRGLDFLEISLKISYEKEPFKKRTVPKMEFLQALYTGAERFFQHMPRIHPVGKLEYERSLKELVELRPKIFGDDA